MEYLRQPCLWRKSYSPNIVKGMGAKMNNKFTKTAQSAINHAFAAAEALGESYVASEHLLLGLLQEKEGIASQLLYKRGITAESTLGLIQQLSAPTGMRTSGVYDLTPRTKKIMKLLPLRLTVFVSTISAQSICCSVFLRNRSQSVQN